MIYIYFDRPITIVKEYYQDLSNGSHQDEMFIPNTCLALTVSTLMYENSLDNHPASADLENKDAAYEKNNTEFIPVIHQENNENSEPIVQFVINGDDIHGTEETSS